MSGLFKSLFGGSATGQQQNANASAGAADAATLFKEQQGFEKQLQDLITNPSSVTSLPGYKFQMDQGTSAVASKMAASGFLSSTAEADALTQFGQGVASNFYGQQAQLLANISGITQSPANFLNASTAAANAATTQSNNLWSGIGSLIGLGVGGSGGGGGLGSMLPFLTSIFSGGSAGAGFTSMGLGDVLGSSAAAAGAAGGVMDLAPIIGDIAPIAMDVASL